MSNRLGLTIRLNQDEQADLRALAEFLKLDQRRVLKLCFTQMVQTVRQLQDKIAKDKQEKDQETAMQEIVEATQELGLD